VYFLGIDLGWLSGASGLCCLVGDGDKLQLQELHRESSLDAVLAWVDQWLPESRPGLVAVDAPTIIPNTQGMRTCDRQAHQLLGKYQAGCYPANQSLGFAARTVGFSQALQQRRFNHAPLIVPKQPGRYQIEVFPHASSIGFFNLSKIIKYKKGRLQSRQAGLGQLRQLILNRLPILDPPLTISHLPEIPPQVSLKTLKAMEDQLDALLCAYTGAYWWAWGLEKNRVLGGPQFNPEPNSPQAYLDTGFIVVPHLNHPCREYPASNPTTPDPQLG